MALIFILEKEQTRTLERNVDGNREEKTVILDSSADRKIVTPRGYASQPKKCTTPKLDYL